MATIHIKTGVNNLDKDKKEGCKIQSVPFKIHADCDANVNKFFNNYVKSLENGVSTASFRGYPLKGKVVDIPDGYTGCVFHESVRPETDKCERKFYVLHHFSKIHYWNWDKIPSDNDNLTQALQWVDIAEALHSPIVEE